MIHFQFHYVCLMVQHPTLAPPVEVAWITKERFKTVYLSCLLRLSSNLDIL